MIGFNITPESFVKGFFDRVKVNDAVVAAKLRYKSKAGAFVRQRIKNLIRNKPGTSKPGSPPFGHGDGEDGLLEKYVFFAYDEPRDSVVIGPAALNLVVFDGDGKPISGTIPEILEGGGQIQILEVFRRGEWIHMSRKRRRANAGLPQRFRRVTIQPRPFARPALEDEAPKFPDLIQL